MSIFKTFALYRKANLQFRAEAFNLTNTVVFAASGTTVGTPTFDKVTAIANNPRQLQFALKLQF